MGMVDVRKTITETNIITKYSKESEGKEEGML